MDIERLVRRADGEAAPLVTFALNLLPAVSAVLFGWPILSLMLLYWLENLVVGVINVAKIVIAGLMTSNRISGLTTLFVAPFFVIHYGFFCEIHGIFLFVLFSGPQIGVSIALETLPGLVLHQVQSSPFLFWNLLLLTSYRVFLFAADWLMNRRWEHVEPAAQMFAPYPRIFVVHLTIMAGGILAIFFGVPWFGVAALAILKSALEAGMLRFGSLKTSPDAAEPV